MDGTDVIFRLPAMTANRRRMLGVIVGVGVLHAGTFALLALQRTPPSPPPPPVFDVELVRPPLPPPPPPPPPTPAPTAGGGAPAAPSRIHTPPVVRPVPPEVPAPRVQAPEPALVVGVAPISSGAPGMGQGGTGAGTGAGDGDGDGPGSGAPPLILRGASQAEILPFVPPAARAARRSGRGSVSCVIRADTRLEDCRIVGETPPGFGFGEAALTIAPRYFRFRPPTGAGGRAVEGYRVTVFVQFGRGG